MAPGYSSEWPTTDVTDMAGRKPTSEQKMPLAQRDNRGSRAIKRGDLVAEQIKRRINDGRARPGKRLDKEAELQQQPARGVVVGMNE